MVQYAYILGCNRSGTTLVQNLFRCAEGTRIINGEVSPPIMLMLGRKLGGEGLMVAKRWARMEHWGASMCGETMGFHHDECAYSYNVSGTTLRSNREEAIPWVEWLECWRSIWYIHVRRDPRDALVSTMYGKPGAFVANFSMWKNAEQTYAQLKRLNPNRTVLVEYERLVAHPDATLEELFTHMGLTKTIAADKWMTHLTDVERGHPSLKWLNGVRAVDTSSIGRWKQSRERIQTLVREHPDLAQTVVDFGYDRPGWHLE